MGGSVGRRRKPKPGTSRSLVGAERGAVGRCVGTRSGSTEAVPKKSTCGNSETYLCGIESNSTGSGGNADMYPRLKGR